MPSPPLDESGFYPRRPPPPTVHQLSLTVVSAQDLHPTTSPTFAVAYLHPSVRHRTDVDSTGRTEPYWNNTFAFRVDEFSLNSETAALTVDIYAAAPRFLPAPDTLIGIARINLSSLRLVVGASPRFVAVQVRRPRSLRPQGILNLSVAILKHNAAPMQSPAHPHARVMTQQKGKGKGKKVVKKKEDPEVEEMEKKLEMWRAELPWLRGDQKKGLVKEESEEEKVEERRRGGHGRRKKGIVEEESEEDSEDEKVIERRRGHGRRKKGIIEEESEDDSEEEKVVERRRGHGRRTKVIVEEESEDDSEDEKVVERRKGHGRRKKEVVVIEKRKEEKKLVRRRSFGPFACFMGWNGDEEESGEVMRTVPRYINERRR